MADTEIAATPDAHDEHGHGHGHDEIHLPPNSWVPLSLAGSLTMFFVGFLIHPVVWIVGALWMVATLAQWARAARTEYRDLSETE